MPRLIQLADFDRPRGGSFLPMLQGVASAARERGWRSELAFFDSAAEASWVGELAADGFEVHLAPSGLRDRDRGLSRWVAELAQPVDGDPVVLHAHFTGFDVALALAARNQPDVHAIWHLHSPLPANPWHFARALLKQGILGRGIDAFLCPADNI